MATEPTRRLSRNGRPPKVVGLGAPISVWIYFEVCEIPALTDAIGEQLTRYGASPQPSGCAARSQANGEPPESSDHVAELRRMLADLQRAAPIYLRRFDVVWPTVLAGPVVRGALEVAKRRAGRSNTGNSAREALEAALQSSRDFDAVDNGGPDAVWL